MSYAVEVVEVGTLRIASVSARVPWNELGAVIPRMLDRVWAALRASPEARAGHNVVVYDTPGPDGCGIRAGVEVRGDWSGGGEVVVTEVPGGRAAHVVHLGPYHLLGKAHDALGEYAAAEGLAPGVHWEVYGDWTEDPAALRTDVYRRIG